jgi:branched-chain amino acid transport system ATP-binding protein
MNDLLDRAVDDGAAANSTRRPMIEASAIEVHFGGVKALTGVDLAVRPGECLGMLGPNGAGKTTLLDVLSGLREPTKGKVFVDGVEVTGKSPTKIARSGVRRTFQRQQPFGWLTVEENVLVALEWRGRSAGLLSDCCGLRSRGPRRAAHVDRVHEVLAMCGLLPFKDQPAAELPIGQIRLLEVARAVVDEPRALLLDEPTSGLGHDESARIGEVLIDIGKSYGCAILLVEHDIEFVFRLASRVMVLVGGQVLADDTPDVVRRDPAVIASYLGSDTEEALE